MFVAKGLKGRLNVALLPDLLVVRVIIGGHHMLIVLLAIVSLILSPVVWGYAISTEWAWFAVPLGLPSLSVAHGIGLSYLVRLFVTEGNHHEDSRTSQEKVASAVSFALFYPLISLLGAYIILQFM